jgi:hypothetical protein
VTTSSTTQLYIEARLISPNETGGTRLTGSPIRATVYCHGESGVFTTTSVILIVVVLAGVMLLVILAGRRRRQASTKPALPPCIQ